MVRSYVPDAGDIVWISFNPQTGHEQAGHRPAVVLSPAAYNVGALSLARAVSDDQLSREILKTVAQLLKDPVRKGPSATAHR
jgi:mRNA-degrading endonuclease toxin of MazEF toxin-antitoxin module